MTAALARAASPAATQPGGQVVAPAAGRVSFAGDYRGYGKIVIIDHGGGWTSPITWNDRAVGFLVGDTLDAGAPVGRAGSDDSRITVELRRARRPVDLVAMLADAAVNAPFGRPTGQSRA